MRIGRNLTVTGARLVFGGRLGGPTLGGRTGQITQNTQAWQSREVVELVVVPVVAVVVMPVVALVVALVVVPVTSSGVSLFCVAGVS